MPLNLKKWRLFGDTFLSRMLSKWLSNLISFCQFKASVIKAIIIFKCVKVSPKCSSKGLPIICIFSHYFYFRNFVSVRKKNLFELTISYKFLRNTGTFPELLLHWSMKNMLCSIKVTKWHNDPLESNITMIKLLIAEMRYEKEKKIPKRKMMI